MESDLGKLFIGGISWDTDEERLKEYFSQYGEVVEAVIMRDRATGRARGFGFVVFTDPAVSERVITEKHVIDGRTVEAKKAVPKDDHQFLSKNTSSIQNSHIPGRTKKIFVGGLPSSITESDFKMYFDHFGTITDVVVMYDHNTQRPRGFGFITYDTEDAVDRVLHKTFHELSGKMVEVKRAVPKELSPGPSRSPLPGYSYGLGRANSFLNNFAQGYNIGSVGGYNVRMDSRFSPLASGRSGFSPFNSPGYGMGLNLDPGMSPGYGGTSNFGSGLTYGRMLTPYISGNSSRYNSPIGSAGANTRSDSVLGSTARNLWGNNGLNNPMNTANPAGNLGSGNGNYGASFGGENWGFSINPQNRGSASSFVSGNFSYGSGDSNYALGGGSYARNTGSGGAPTSALLASSGSFESSYGDLYRTGSVYGDSTWRSATPELDGSASFGYGLDNMASEVNTKTSEGYTGSYGVSSRQTNRGLTT